ncbi:MAG: ATP-binding cassette domain-containing protein [Candidatus Wallbacteria bacterium]|nr:ATP-binding cassette domain-containing protein [Candidatus Wallbacteria bacterium]
MIKLKNLSLYLDGKTRNLEISELEVQPGDFWYLAGRNGSGKTTLLEYLGGLSTCYPQARFEAESTENSYKKSFVVLQNIDSPFFYDTVANELSHSLIQQGGEDSTQALTTWAEKIGLKDKLELPVRTLSAGEKQRLILGIALISRPDLLLLDEPTAHLDSLGSDLALGIFREFQIQGGTMMITDHKTREIKGQQGHFLGLEKGGVVSSCVWNGNTINSALIERFGLYPDQHAGSAGNREQGESVIKLESFGICFENGNQLFQDVNLELKRGQWIHLSGLNGTGKTTLINLILGRIKQSAGTICRKPGLKFGYLPQNFRYFAQCDTFAEEIEFIKKRNINSLNSDDLIETLGLKHLLERDPLYLSRGESQRVFLFLALLSRPDVLILDEPASGQDFQSLTAMMGVLDRMVAQGMALILVSHEDWLGSYADTVWEIKEKKICSDSR